MNVWITSDTHFNHSNICGPKLSKWPRGYRNFDSLNEMNAHIIDSINTLVMPEDTLYHLGDFAMGMRSEIPNLRARIACRNIVLIRGNHDHQLVKSYANEFQRITHYAERKVDGTLVCMMHYPIAAWNENGRGSVNLHGHSHGTYRAVGRQYDVGMDCNDFMPLNLEEIVKTVKEQEIVLADHHDERTNYH